VFEQRRNAFASSVLAVNQILLFISFGLQASVAMKRQKNTLLLRLSTHKRPWSTEVSPIWCAFTQKGRQHVPLLWTVSTRTLSQTYCTTGDAVHV
jgi:hypothetical protein